ncbi:hypothetical protein TWF718_006849 [Orbilia javanica]|uniref:Uncharacterized protein n=1 Tax=Orbilia javanica TaxID=47235 RepID=A0AAN8MTB0_9PEZI
MEPRKLPIWTYGHFPSNLSAAGLNAAGSKGAGGDWFVSRQHKRSLEGATI